MLGPKDCEWQGYVCCLQSETGYKIVGGGILETREVAGCTFRVTVNTSTVNTSVPNVQLPNICETKKELQTQKLDHKTLGPNRPPSRTSPTAETNMIWRKEAGMTAGEVESCHMCRLTNEFTV